MKELSDEDYTTVVAGSDQIWNITIEDGDDVYFLPWVKKARKVAYAPSFGSKNILKYTKEIDKYKFSKKFMENKFQAVIYIDSNNKISGKVIDLEFNDKVDESINKEKIELEWKEFISVYFDRQLKEIIINFISLGEI
jgi:hypothetical protein